MPLRESEAVVLRSYPLGEADRLVSLLSRSLGRIRGVARGARRPKSRFGSTLEILSHIRVWFYERETRELVRINQCELVESFLDVQRDYERGLALALLSEITEAVLPEREPSDAAFRLLLHAAQALKQGADVSLCLTYFALWTVRLAGWLPDLSRCGRCGRELGNEAAFAGYSSLACSRCRMPGMMPLGAKSLAAARKMLEQRLDRIVAAKAAAGLGDLQEYLMDTIESQIERKLSARRMLHIAARNFGAGLRESDE
jgi:DNA repair protein RecO (recombination protein O)